MPRLESDHLLRRPRRYLLPLLCWCISLFCCGGAGAGAPYPPGPTTVPDKDLLRTLAASRQWHALLHYRPVPNAPNGLRSEVSSPAFFLSPDGPVDPFAELQSTIEAFSAPVFSGSEPPRCRFPARFFWLEEALAGLDIRLPNPSCPEFDGWLRGLEPASLVLVFAEAYLNNPASMFGHTLLRIDLLQDAGTSPLLSPVIAFAATTGDERGATFAFKGLTGGYAGRYLIAPYHASVREYGDIDNRDIWEYRLHLGPKEVRLLLAHAYELRDMDFPYYFLNRNCSSQLLRLLEVARPQLAQDETFSWWVIPADTVRAMARAGLTGEHRYRPSRCSMLEWRFNMLPENTLGLLDHLAGGGRDEDWVRLAALPSAQQAGVLELAAQKRLYDQVRGTGAEQGEDPYLQELYIRRSSLPETLVPPVPAPAVSPDQGHPSSRMTAGGGVRDGQPFSSLSIRPALHDLLDPGGGYVPGASVEVLGAEFRHYPGSQALELNSLVLLGMRSLASGSPLLHPLSWEGRLALERYRFDTAGDQITAVLRGGGGVTKRWHEDLLAYALVHGITLAGSGPDAGYAVGAGASAGLLFTLGKQVHGQLSTEATAWIPPHDDRSWLLGLELAGRPGTDCALRFALRLRRDFAGPYLEAAWAFSLFF